MDRSGVLRTAFACAGLVLLAPAARAEEPLFLRIRPLGAPPAEIGSAGSGAASAQARAAREAIWERSTRRANIAIASVCRGCLQPEAVVQRAMGFGSPPPPGPATREEAPGPTASVPAAPDAPGARSGMAANSAANSAAGLAQP